MQTVRPELLALLVRQLGRRADVGGVDRRQRRGAVTGRVRTAAVLGVDVHGARHVHRAQRIDQRATAVVVQLRPEAKHVLLAVRAQTVDQFLLQLVHC